MDCPLSITNVLVLSHDVADNAIESVADTTSTSGPSRRDWTMGPGRRRSRMNVTIKLNPFDAELLSGFGDAVTFADLRAEPRRRPGEVAGVYAVIYPFDHEPRFLDEGTGGSHKKKDPNVSAGELRERWVPDTRLLYFGKAGGAGKKSHLRERVDDYSQFGLGAKTGHWGGRLIWQLEDSASLLVCWKQTVDGDEPKAAEHRLIRQFIGQYRKLPFANLAD